ncbi:MAG: hypothetical protein MR209_00730 [Veillonellaceae bacterium]|nr:hypothetical protein [Veillonellaceae bacterium]
MFPYLVVIMVALAFLGVCRFFFYTPSQRRRAPYVPREYARSKDLHASHPMPVHAPAEPVAAIAEEEPAEEENAAEDLEQTLVVSRDSLTALAQGEEEVPAAAGEASLLAEPEVAAEPEPEITATLQDTGSLLRRHVRHFLLRYATVTPELARDAQTVTERALEKLGTTDESVVQDTLAHIMVQEALLNAQRIYVMMPEPLILNMVTNAFAEVAQGERDDTLTLLAYDALQVMTHLEPAHFRILSLLLIFHHSHHSDNTTTAAFRRYARKYVEPFLQHLPTEYSYFEQLEYLRCTDMRQPEQMFGRVLRESYPLFFGYRGFTREELAAATAGRKWAASDVVHSFYADYFKFPAAQEKEMELWAHRLGIRNSEEFAVLLQLQRSRPVPYDRRELAARLAKVAPALGRLCDAWDTSMMRYSAPTLLGMYIARLYIREIIGEDFDLQHWV